LIIWHLADLWQILGSGEMHPCKIFQILDQGILPEFYQILSHNLAKEKVARLHDTHFRKVCPVFEVVL